MNAMNETILQLRIVEYLNSGEAWGRDQGRYVSRLLEDEIVKSGKAGVAPKVVILDFTGLTKMDASFPQEAVVEVSRKFRGTKYFVLTNIDNEAIEENMSMAFEKRSETGLIRDARGLRIIGAQLPSDFEKIIKFAEGREFVTSKEVQDYLGLSIQNASNKLKAIWELGLLQRSEGSAKSGGRENIYSKVG